MVLEWDPIDLATAELRSLSLYRNGTKAGVIPRDKLSTKISGLALDTEYTFHLVLRTSAGQYTSEKLAVKTHKMTDLSGISITPGIMPGQLKDSLAETVSRIGAKMVDSVRIDTTHFVCTEARGQAWEKAVEMNVPVVVPDWIKGCEREGRIVGVRGYYLDADPKLRQIGPSTHQQRGSISSGAPARDSPRIEHTPPTPDRSNAANNENGAGTVTEQRASGSEEEERDGSSREYAEISEKQVDAEDSDEDDEDDKEDDNETEASSEHKTDRPAQTPQSADKEEFDEVQL